MRGDVQHQGFENSRADVSVSMPEGFKAAGVKTQTIVARATAMGRAGIGIVRLSGPHAFEIAQKITQKTCDHRTAHFTEFHSASGDLIDQGICLGFRSPHSFTGEDVIEFQAHGSPAVLDWLIETAVTHGARLARAGEFSERAFLNGKMDLTQAEAVMDLIHASSREAAKSAVASLSGVFSQRIHALLDALIRLRVFVEAMIDFPDEDIDALSSQRILDQLTMLTAHVNAVCNTAKQGEMLHEGVTLVIVGRPNAGKSSLLNAFSGQETAIVTDIPGTTRDTLKIQIHLDGLPIHVIDTAGLRKTEDPVEQEGVRRAYAAAENADHVIWLLALSELSHYKEIESDVMATLPPQLPVTVVINKIDQQDIYPIDPMWLADIASRYTVIQISAKHHMGLEALKTHLLHSFGFSPQKEGQFMARRRHLDALSQVLKHLSSGQQVFESAHALELLAEDLRCAQEALNTITGDFRSDDLLGEIFSTFCIGK